MLNKIRRQLTDYQPQRATPDMPEAAVLIPLAGDSGNPEIILTRRSMHMNSHGGEVALPGGKRDPEDADLAETVLRECYEEIALQRHQVELLGTTNDVVSRFGLKVTPFVGIVDDDVDLVANPDELDRIFRVPVSFFLENSPDRVDKIVYRHATYYVPAWHYGEYPVWGLTAIMLVEFFNISLGTEFSLCKPWPQPEIKKAGMA